MLQPADPIQTIIQWFIEFWLIWGTSIFPFLVVILIWIILIITNGILSSFIRRRAVRVGVPPDAVNGLVLAIRLAYVWIGVVVFAAVVPQIWAFTVVIVGNASVIIGLAVGLAIGQAMRNFIAGLYVMFSDPFDIGDYVRIGGNEGIVLEVSINYTKLRKIDGSIVRIPNDSVMNSSVTNFQFERKRMRKPKLDEVVTGQGSLPTRIRAVISKVMDTSKLIQYTFELQFPVTTKHDKYEQICEKVCKKWEQIFGYKPVFALTSIDPTAFTYAFTIFVENPQLLIEYRSEFIEDIGRAIY